MKILTETEYYAFHPVLGVACLILGLFLLGLVIAMIFTVIKEGDYEYLLPIIFVTVISVPMFVGFNASLDRKMIYKYKATITDFNEVYDKGYEITDREGEIYTLIKEDK